MAHYTNNRVSADEQLRIILKDAEPVLAPLHDCKTFSTVARALPQTSEWNLSGLVIDGASIKRETVLQWLSFVEQLTESPQLQERDQLSTGIRTTASLYSFIAFADAVGSRRGLLMAGVSNLPSLQLQVAVDKQQIDLPIDVGAFTFWHHSWNQEDAMDDGTAATVPMHLSELRQETLDPDDLVLIPGLTQEQCDSIATQISEQLEQLLFISYKLNLEPLIDRLHGILRTNTMDESYIIYQRADSILFTERVLSAISISSHARRVWSNSMFGAREELPPLKFKAVLAKDFMGKSKGTTVYATLDLCDITLSLDLQDVPSDEASNVYGVELRLTDRGRTS